MRAALAAIVAACGALGCAAPAGATSFGDLGCLQDPTETVSAPCISQSGLQAVAAVGVSPDGRFVYAGSYMGQITVFGRDALGALQQKQCVNADGSGGCILVTNLPVQSITDVEATDANVYVGTHDGVIAAFKRDGQSGELTPLGCVAGAGTGTSCTDAKRTGAGTQTISSSWVAPTSNLLYAGGEAKNVMAITMYDRGSDGTLTQSPASASDKSYCVSDNGVADEGMGACADVSWAINTFALAFNADATRAYATANDAQALIAFDRPGGARALTAPATCIGDTTSTTCPNHTAVGLEDPTDVVVSPSTGDVYVSSPSKSTVAVFRPDLSEIGCIAEAGTQNAGGVCAAQAHGITGANALALSPDGKHLYVAGSTGQSVAELTVASNGMLSQPAPTCLSSAPGSGCASDTALDTGGGGTSAWDLTNALAISRPNTVFQVATPNLYAAAPGSSALHVLALTAPAQITLKTPTVKCTSASCQFVLKCTQAHNCSVATSVTVPPIKPRVRVAGKPKAVVVAAGKFTVPKGKSKRLRARTTKAGRKLLSASRKHHRKKLAAKLTVKVKGEARPSVFRVTLRP